MTAKEWREKSAAAAEVVELTLPSGMVITARRPGPMQFAAWDRLPMMVGLAGGSACPTNSDEEAVEIAGFLREMLIYCCVEPRVSMNPGADEIAPRDVSEADWTHIVRWAMRLEEAEKVRRFRGQRADGRGGDHGEAVFVQAIGTDGDRGSGAGTGVRPGGGAEGTGDGAGSGGGNAGGDRA